MTDQNNQKKKIAAKLPGAETPDGWLASLRDYTVLIAIALGIAMLVTNFIMVRSVVDGSSMNPTLNDGESVIVSRISYTLSDPKRFDICVLELEDDPGVYYIKRIIGLPGETVQIVNGQVYIDGSLLAGDIYGNEPIIRPGRAVFPVKLGENEYFVMGDNRNNSQDSRYDSPGNISRSQLVGKAVLRVWPLSSFSVITHQ